MPPGEVPPLTLKALTGVLVGMGSQTGVLGSVVSFALWKAKMRLLVLAYFNWMVWDNRAFQVDKQRAKPPEWMMWLPKWIGEYFDLSIIRTVPIDPHQGPFMFCMHPHGIFGFGPQATAPFIERTVSPGLNIRHAGIKGVFYVPIFREFAIAFNTIPVDQDLMRDHLKEGVSLTVVIGGAAEALLTGYPDVLPIVLDKRKGFVRLAVETGARLVPCFNFGESQTYSQVFNQSLRSVQSTLMDYMGFSLPVLKPNFWFAPFLPKRAKLTMVVGEPLDPVRVDPKDAKFERAVDEMHGKYVEALKELHAKNKETYGLPSEQELVIISSEEAKDLNKLKSKL